MVPTGDTASPKTPESPGRDLGVLAVIVLLLESGRVFGVDCTFCIWDSGCFFIEDMGFETVESLLGVAVGVLGVAALTLLLPGAVIDPRCDGPANRLGVDGVARGVPSLVIGRLLFPSWEPGRGGGAIGLSAEKKLDLRLVFPAGDDGSCDKLSTVRSDNDGRDFLVVGT